MEDQIQQIADLGRQRAPDETGGVLLPAPHQGKWVWELPNHDPSSHDGMEIHVKDIRAVLGEWLETEGQTRATEVVLWHTHPGGHIGPSREDLERAVPDLNCLVVTLTQDGHIPVWYRSKYSVDC